MIFDLQGKRRRLVQAVYLTLAILMGGGLVLFGIGGEVSGGLFDAFSNRGADTGSGNAIVERRVQRAEERLRANPRDEAALKDLARGNYQLAQLDAEPTTGQVSAAGRERLRAASRAWERYLALDPRRPDDSLAGLMVQAYSPEIGLNDPPRATRAAEIVAAARPSSNAYLQLAQFATLAGQTRKADLAGQQAVRLAPRADRPEVRRLVQQVKAGTASG